MPERMGPVALGCTHMTHHEYMAKSSLLGRSLLESAASLSLSLSPRLHSQEKVNPTPSVRARALVLAV